MSSFNVLAAVLAVALVTGTAGASPVWFINDFEGFVEAAGEGLQVIDFETLPDGSPSYPGVEITPDFNYTHLGVTFLSPRPWLFIVGNPLGYSLKADSYPDPDANWIIAELVTLATSVGTFFPGTATLSIYDDTGALITQETVGGAGDQFLGVISDIPVALATVDRVYTYALIRGFYFVPVPEPGTLLLLVLGAFTVRARCRG